LVAGQAVENLDFMATTLARPFLAFNELLQWVAVTFAGQRHQDPLLFLARLNSAPFPSGPFPRSRPGCAPSPRRCRWLTRPDKTPAAPAWPLPDSSPRQAPHQWDLPC